MWIRGSQDSDNLLWLVTEGKNTVNPEFIATAGITFSGVNTADNSGDVQKKFAISDQELEEVHNILANGGKTERTYTVELRDGKNEVCTGPT